MRQTNAYAINNSAELEGDPHASGPDGDDGPNGADDPGDAGPHGADGAHDTGDAG